MSEAFIVAAAHLPVEPGQSRAGAAGDVLTAVLRSAGLPAKRVAEIHWQVPPRAATQASRQREQELDVELLGPWLIQLAQRLSFPPDLAAFLWPAAPLLDHFVLQAAVRCVQSGQRELVAVGQFSSQPGANDGLEQAGALLLAGPAAVGRYNLAPRARAAALLAVNAAQGGLLASARAGLHQLAERERARRQPLPSKPAGQHLLPLPQDFNSGAAAPAQDAPEPERFDLPLPEEITWLASAAQADGLQDHFPRAQWAADGPPATGALLLLIGLLSALEARSDDCGLLLSSGPQETGLITLLERT